MMRMALLSHKAMHICLGTDVLLKIKMMIIVTPANPVRCSNDNVGGGGGWQEIHLLHLTTVLTLLFPPEMKFFCFLFFVFFFFFFFCLPFFFFFVFFFFWWRIFYHFTFQKANFKTIPRNEISLSRWQVCEQSFWACLQDKFYSNCDLLVLGLPPTVLYKFVFLPWLPYAFSLS